MECVSFSILPFEKKIQIFSGFKEKNTLKSWSYESFLFDYVSKTENDDHENAIVKTHNEHCTNQPRDLGNFRKAFDWVLLFFVSF